MASFSTIIYLINVTSDVQTQLDNKQSITAVATISQGGTNSNIALNNNQLMVSNLGAVKELGAMNNGQIVIGNTGNLPAIATLTGTANQVIITNSAGSITLSLPQSIDTSSSPTFSTATLSSIPIHSILFAGTGGVITQDSAKLFWDNINKRLCVGATTSSINTLTVADNTSNPQGVFISTNNSSTGGTINLLNNPASALSAFMGLGTILFSGAYSNSATQSGSLIQGYTTQIWNSNNQGSGLIFQTTQNNTTGGNTGMQTALILDQDQSATFGGNATFPAGKQTTINGTVVLAKSAYAGIFPSYGQQWLKATSITTSPSFLTMASGGYVVNNQNNITLSTSGLFFTLGVGKFRLVSNIFTRFSTTGFITVMFTDNTGAPIGSSNRKGLAQSITSTLAISDGTYNPATTFINVASGTINVYVQVYGLIPAVTISNGDWGSYIEIFQIG